MPRQNRVTPQGEIECASSRGLFMGNRGILHDDTGALGAARWRHKHWVCCVLEFGTYKQVINGPSHYTQLFFLDEAVSLAAGHRPCAECRRADHKRFTVAWKRGHELPEDQPLRVAEIDARLHEARVAARRSQRAIRAVASVVPDGAFIALDHRPADSFLVWKGRLRRWSHDGYTEGCDIPARSEVLVLTPEPSVRALAAGYEATVHPSADQHQEKGGDRA